MKEYEKETAISMYEFLINYVGIVGMVSEEDMNKLARATHRDIKELNIPYIKAVPFDCVEIEDVRSGNIIYVYDGKSTRKNKRVAPYIRPEILMNKEIKDNISNDIDTVSEGKKRTL